MAGGGRLAEQVNEELLCISRIQDLKRWIHMERSSIVWIRFGLRSVE